MTRNWPNLLPIFIFLVGVWALLVAYYFELFHDLYPCVLCLYQRIPYGLCICLGIFSFYKQKSIEVCVLLAAICFFINMIIASYHFGVEKHWWTSILACESNLISVSSVDQLKAMLLTKTKPACDSVEWTFFGISMAGYNALISINLGLICLLGYLKLRRTFCEKI